MTENMPPIPMAQSVPSPNETPRDPVDRDEEEALLRQLDATRFLLARPQRGVR